MQFVVELAELAGTLPGDDPAWFESLRQPIGDNTSADVGSGANGFDCWSLIAFKDALTVGALKVNACAGVPDEADVYVVLYEEVELPKFLAVGTGGKFKGRDPNVSPEKLQAKWIGGERVAYIGQAGRDASAAALRKRLRQLLAFGEGKPAAHRGGRYLWQLADSDKLKICWAATGLERIESAK